MRVPILLWSILHALAIHNDGRDGNNNDEIEHMRSIEVERKELIFQVSEEMIPGFSRVLLQLFDGIWHRASPKASGVAKASAVYTMGVSMSCSWVRHVCRLVVFACCPVMLGRSERGSAVANVVGVTA